MSQPYKFKEAYQFDGNTYGALILKADMVSEIDAYVNDGRQLNRFLHRVAENNLKEAVHEADDDNLRNISAALGYFYNKTPRDCWGSPEEVDAWYAKHSEKGD